MRSYFSKPLQAMFIPLAMGFAIGAACEDGTGPLRTATTCAAYCNQAKDCDEDIDLDECKEDCENAIDDCMDDEQEQALDDLDECSDEACSAFAACTIGAGLQCTFGL